MALIDSLRKLVAREFEVDLKLVTPETVIDEDLGGKSKGIDLFEFWDEIEQKYGLCIAFQELTVQQLADRIREHRMQWWRRLF